MRRSIVALVVCSLVIGLAAVSAVAADPANDAARKTVSVHGEFSIPDVIQTVVREAGANVVMEGEVKGTIALDRDNVAVERVLDDIYQAKGFYWWRDLDGTYYVATHPQPALSAEVSAPASLPARPSSAQVTKTYTLHFFPPQFICYLFGTSEEPGPLPFATEETVQRMGVPLVLGGRSASSVGEMHGGGRGGGGGAMGGGLGGGGLGGGGLGGGGRGGGGGLGGGGLGGGGLGGGGLGGGGLGGRGGGGLGGAGGGGALGGGAGSLVQFLPADVTDIVAVPILNGLIIRGSEQGVNELIEFIKLLDRKPQQIIVELQSVVVSTEYTKRFGIQWFYTLGNTTIQPFGFDPGGGTVRIGYTNHENFQATLSYLLTTGHGRITDAIRISTMNLLPAYNAVVVQYPLIQVGGVAGGGLGGGGVQTVTLTYLPIQTYLQILPQILGDGTINMVIPYQKTTRTGSVPVPLATYGSYEAPIWTINSLLTTINVRDGETFVVGGFVGGQTQENELRFPILGDLPLIGDLLFTRRTKTVTETETLIFITPRIVKEEAAPVTLGPI